ncbi:MAG: hypothetical protein R3C61_15730 [Bacteroidia bacterium]
MFKNPHTHRAVLKWLILCSLVIMTVQLMMNGGVPPLDRAKKKTFVQIREALNAVSQPAAGPSESTYSYTGDHIRFSLPHACSDQMHLEVVGFGGSKHYSKIFSGESLTSEIDFNVDFLSGGVYFMKVRCENYSMTRLFIR